MKHPSSGGHTANTAYVALAVGESKAALHSKPALPPALPLTGRRG
jgi:hypothetical protein